ncbi:MAG: hydrogenase expression/formation protein HypE [Nevskia sp.]|nr:hydrogenase expression/formation protein HypE [Nevskia sp.]
MARDMHISLAHGNGGRQMRELIQEVFSRHLGNPVLDTNADAASIVLPDEEIMITTDGFTVHPLEFPGGDIGSLAINGTVNDLAVSGADPHYLTLSCFIEEGFEIARLDRLIASMAVAADTAGVRIAAGDTKVLRRGEGGGLYLSTTGVGTRRRGLKLDMMGIHPGDKILMSGPTGDHGAAILLARGEFGLYGELRSDCAAVTPVCRAVREIPGLRLMRDPTRGGLATVAHEIMRSTGLSIRLKESHIPIRPAVQAICEMLGYNPLYLACEGRVVVVVSSDSAPAALAAMRAAGSDAAEIGVMTEHGGSVVLETGLGGERLLEELESDPLPRIC